MSACAAVTTVENHGSSGEPRDPALEVFRGLAILEVVVHHVTSFARLHIHPDTFSNQFYTVINRTLHFAVPCFLFLMALILSRSMCGGKRSWRDFYRRRSVQTVAPYLLWTALYLLFALWQNKVTVEQLGSWRSWVDWLVFGKAWFHLYFLSLAIQLYVTLPALLAVVQRSRGGLAGVLTGAVVLQAGLYVVHGLWIRSPYPNSLLIWHVIPVLAGVWLGTRLEHWEAVWRQGRIAFIAITAAAWAIHLPDSIAQLQGRPVDPIRYQALSWTYTSGMAFILLALSRGLAKRAWPKLVRALQSLGTQTMPIYLMHPMILFFWYKTTPSGTTLTMHVTILMAIVAAVGGSLLLWKAALKLRLAMILFGRGEVPLAPLSRVPPVLKPQTDAAT